MEIATLNQLMRISNQVSKPEEFNFIKQLTYGDHGDKCVTMKLSCEPTIIVVTCSIFIFILIHAIPWLRYNNN